MDSGSRGPDAAGGVVGFVAAMRALKVGAGNPSLLDLARRSAVPRSTIADALNTSRRGLPRLEVVVALVEACGATPAEVADWRRGWTEVQQAEDQRGRDQAPPAAGGRNFLPGDVADFTGRAAELDRLLADAEADPGAGARVVVISAIDGMAGVGKTTLAVHAAHRLASDYPDGQFYLNLHGHTPGREPLEAGPALYRLLGLLGVPAERIPQHTEDRAALWRAELAGLSAVLVLDNAATAEQVRPLLPGGSDCVVLITSRRRLVDLDGTSVLPMDVMPPPDAVTLFERVAGPGRVEGQAGAVAEAVRLCGYLPLAIRIAAARLRHRPRWTVTDLIERIRDQAAVTEADDGQVALAFEMSHRRLEPAQQRVFGLLGLHPGVDIDVSAAAALTLLPVRRVAGLLEDLLDHHLLQQDTPRRYTFHDLLREHSRRLVTRTVGQSERDAALTRLFDHYRHTAATAMDLLYPHERDRRPHPARPEPVTISLPDPAAAEAWLATELPNLVVSATVAAAGPPGHSQDLSGILYRYLDLHSHYADALAVHTAAIDAAGDDAAGRTPALINLGAVYWRLGHFPEAIDQYQRALASARASGDGVSQSRALSNLGLTYVMTGRYREALDHNRQALALVHEVGDRVGESHILDYLGIAHAKLGHYPEALDHRRRALALSVELGDRAVETRARCNFGILFIQMGRHPEATEHLERALAMAREIGDRSVEAHALCSLGMLHGRAGRFAEAVDHQERGLALHRELGDLASEARTRTSQGIVDALAGRYAEAADLHRRALVLAAGLGDRSLELEALNGLGEAIRGAGDPAEAVGFHERALVLATDLEDRYEGARAHAGLGAAHDDLGAADRAREHWRAAHLRYADLGVPEAGEAARRLAAG